MNPSTKDILDAINACVSDQVVVLPNDKNIILAAEQAVGMTGKQVRVVKSRSVPQGLAALLAVNPEEGVAENAPAMEEALGSVRTIEITPADNKWIINSLAVAPGELIMPEGATNRTLDLMAGHGLTWTILPYDRMQLNGGGIHCSTTPLIRDPV